MDRELYMRAGAWLEAHREELAADIMRLVRIPSVSDPASGTAPFGEGCRRVMDEMLQIGREHGFVAENYGYYVGSIGTGEKNWDNMIGFWNHLDVVPAGNGWRYEPFQPVRKGNFLIGRGAQDNKGPAVGMLYVMQCLRELAVPLKHELCLFVGCDEERGMEDLEWYAARYPCPAMSMIADSGFPVCYGEKGILEGGLVSEREWSDAVISCFGGSAGNIIPDQAHAVFRENAELYEEILCRIDEKNAGGTLFAERTAEGIRVSAKGTAKHSAFPEGSRNAIWELASFLKEHPAVSILTELYNEITGERTESFVMGGGTYARKLPNAFAYGVGGLRETGEEERAKAELFGPGRGGAHEPDEGLNLRQLLEALRIYAVSIAALNDCPL